jgi:hypothetical protein
MKKILIFFLILILIFSITFSLAYENFPRSIDPSQIKEENPSIEILSLYSNIGKFASNLDFKSTINISLALKEIYIPKNLLYIFQRFNNLLNETLNQMNITNNYVKLASIYLNSSDFKNAENCIHNASKEILFTKIKYNELYDASFEFSRNMGIYHDKIIQMLNDIEIGIKKLEFSINEILKKIENIKPKIINAFLYMNVEPLSINYGEEITINGFLYDENGNMLSFREIVIHVGNNKYIIKTNSFGRYYFNCKIIEYIKRIPVYAEYIPKKEDFEKISYAISKIFYVNISYIIPKMKISISQTKVKPMDNIKIYINSLPNLKIKISFLSNIIEGSTNNSGIFYYDFTIPSNIDEGTYNITISSLPKGIIGPYQTILEIIVYKLELNYSIDFPSLVITGVPFKIKINTNTNSTIFLTSPIFGTIIDHGLNSSKEIILPLTYLNGSFSFLIKIIPDEPWYRISFKSFSIKVINMLGIILIIPLFAIIFLSYLSIKKETFKIIIEKPMYKISQESLKERKYSYPSNLFFKFIKLIEKKFNIIMKPSETLREYLRKISILPKKLYEEIAILFLNYEKFIYGGSKYRDKNFIKKIVEIIKNLINKIKEGKED